MGPKQSKITNKIVNDAVLSVTQIVSNKCIESNTEQSVWTLYADGDIVIDDVDLKQVQMFHAECVQSADVSADLQSTIQNAIKSAIKQEKSVLDLIPGTTDSDIDNVVNNSVTMKVVQDISQQVFIGASVVQKWYFVSKGGITIRGVKLDQYQNNVAKAVQSAGAVANLVNILNNKLISNTSQTGFDWTPFLVGGGTLLAGVLAIWAIRSSEKSQPSSKQKPAPSKNPETTMDETVVTDTPEGARAIQNLTRIPYYIGLSGYEAGKAIGKLVLPEDYQDDAWQRARYALLGFEEDAPTEEAKAKRERKKAQRSKPDKKEMSATEPINIPEYSNLKEAEKALRAADTEKRRAKLALDKAKTRKKGTTEIMKLEEALKQAEDAYNATLLGYKEAKIENEIEKRERGDDQEQQQRGVGQALVDRKGYDRLNNPWAGFNLFEQKKKNPVPGKETPNNSNFPEGAVYEAPSPPPDVQEYIDTKQGVTSAPKYKDKLKDTVKSTAQDESLKAVSKAERSVIGKAEDKAVSAGKKVLKGGKAALALEKKALPIEETVLGTAAKVELAALPEEAAAVLL